MDKEAKILVVEDEKPLRELLEMELSRSGYKVESAADGETGLEKYRQEVFNVVLLDMRMPGMDGVEVLKQMRAESLIPEVIVFTGHGTIETAVECIRNGAYDYLTKPVKLDELEMVIDKAYEKNRLRLENISLKLEIDKLDQHRIVGKSAVIQKALETVRRWGATDEHVLIEGESGAGKEVVARAVHFESGRAEKPFMQVNCAALPEHLLESELFGHERGAFTDAHTQKRGLFESAEGGSVMLDEIGDLPPGGQAKLLRLLENKTFRRVGGVQEFRADVRVLAATNVDLEERVAEGRFRADLFFRLNVVRIVMPALRDHPEDIPILAAHFIARFNQEMKREVKGLSPAAIDALTAYHWPGNVRELRNVVERAFILHASADEIRPEHLSPEVRRAVPQKKPEKLVPQVPDQGLVLDDVERKLIAEAMERASGNQSKAARLLGISRDTLRYRLKKHGMG
jgi:DNA-binding NtrC family response regulator